MNDIALIVAISIMAGIAAFTLGWRWGADSRQTTIDNLHRRLRRWEEKLELDSRDE